jgi:two-component sensor histidine kinase
MKQAFPIGIIVNELITNARKYAFLGRDGGIIRTSLRSGEDNYIEIKVSDNGTGFLEQSDTEDTGSGFGMTLVRAYAAQYGGEVQIESKKGEGSSLTVTLKRG